MNSYSMNFVIEKAEVSDAQVMGDLIRQVYEEMEQKEWYVTDDAAYIERMLSGGRGIGYLAREAKSRELAGIFLVTIPGDEPWNLGNDIGFSGEQKKAAAHMESAAVLKKYQGNHLQYRLMQAAEQDLRDGGFKYLLCTIHPENRFSKGNVLRQGYRVAATKEKYGGYLRDILVKEL